MYEALPLYNCHKQVRAAKIVQIDKSEYDGVLQALLYVEESPDGAIRSIPVDADYLARCPKLAVGGYFVVYQEGDEYTSYSPAGPFEGGYTLAE